MRKNMPKDMVKGVNRRGYLKWKSKAQKLTSEEQEELERLSKSFSKTKETRMTASRGVNYNQVQQSMGH
jgi:uncharacterized protein YnzC (UPF0291/DUF896 family)